MLYICVEQLTHKSATQEPVLLLLLSPWYHLYEKAPPHGRRRENAETHSHTGLPGTFYRTTAMPLKILQGAFQKRIKKRKYPEIVGILGENYFEYVFQRLY